MRLQFLLLLTAVLPVHAEWSRFYMGPKGSSGGGPAGPHTLAYFSHHALLRPESCEDCTPEERSDLAKNSRVDVVKAGVVGRLEIYDVSYRHENQSADRSVIVKVGPTNTTRFSTGWHSHLASRSPPRRLSTPAKTKRLCGSE